jgi:hypothetical protein
MTTYEERREKRRRFLRRNMSWLIPLGAVVGAGLFVGLGFLVAWLWRVTLGDIFGLKPISFWQAWGLMVLCQILFKANVQPTTRTGSMHRSRSEHAAGPATEPALPEQGI